MKVWLIFLSIYIYLFSVSGFMLFTVPFRIETFSTNGANIRATVAVLVHVGCIVGFVHKSLVTFTAVESILSSVLLHVIPISSCWPKTFGTKIAVISRWAASCGIRLIHFPTFPAQTLQNREKNIGVKLTESILFVKFLK